MNISSRIFMSRGWAGDGYSPAPTGENGEGYAQTQEKMKLLSSLLLATNFTSQRRLREIRCSFFFLCGEGTTTRKRNYILGLSSFP
jgi:hypothetical protein